ncbi:non-homologous end joining protein Ku [Beijerinckia mobilis]|uniref:non-homologous end joining protein Ku n=1 Tax=Beijerinckia mobilis TaxID=231434 RepID=UPI00054FAE23|nr:Ku protein [Beijerinckia mobilis]
MAPRLFWEGYLKLSLVTCAVALTPALSENEKIRFHTINRKTGNRVVSEYVDAVTGKAVEKEDEVKGYARGENDYVMLEDEEIDAVALESTQTIAIDRFVPKGAISWIWYDRPYYLTPNDDVGTEAFCVIRDAMAATRTAGISRLVLFRREHSVMLVPHGKGIILWTLRYGDEVRKEEAYFAEISNVQPDPDQMPLIRKLIDTHMQAFDPKMVSDPVRERLLALIASKRKAKRRTEKRRLSDGKQGNVIDIIDALRQSLAADKHTQK